MYEPGYSPWGKLNSCRKLCDGAYMVDTPGHGGIMVAKARVNALLSPDSQKIGFMDGNYLCFEEDCEATVAFRELLDRKLITTYPGYLGTPAEFEKAINDGVRHWYPEYWKAREQRITAEMEHTRSPRKERER